MTPAVPQREGRHTGQRNRRVWAGMLILCAIGAAAAARRIVAFSSPLSAGSADSIGLDTHFAAKAALTLVHIVPSLLFILLLPLQFVSRLRRRYPRFHRVTGRVLVILGMVIGLSALGLSTSPVGGVTEAAATTLFGCYFLFALGKAWLHIRNRQVERHREWAIRMASVALGVATTRPIIGIFFATSRLTGLTPHQFFGPAMWLGFVSTCLAGEVYIARTRARAGQNRAAAIAPGLGETRPANAR
jgi:uncharacterized membrane protein